MNDRLHVVDREHNNRVFKDTLLRSRAAVNLFAAHLFKRGYPVELPDERVAPDYESRMAYRDDGDLFTRIAGHRVRIEVKARENIEFTSADDYPYPTIMVCAAHSWEMSDPKPWLYVIINRSRTVAAYIRGSTQPEWWVEERQDKRYMNYSQRFCFARLDCICKWVRLNAVE